MALLVVAVLLFSQIVIAAHDHADDLIDREQCELCVKIHSDPEAVPSDRLLHESESGAKPIFNKRGLPTQRSTLIAQSRAPPLSSPQNALV